MFQNIVELHSIIQAMPPNQKRHFTMHCKIAKPDSNSLVLFNALNKLEKYDEEKLKKHLKKDGRSKLAENLITETILLYKLVCKVIRFITDEKSIDRKLRNIFNNIILLQERGFFLKSMRMLRKLKKDAYDYDQKILLLEICKYERKMIRNGFAHRGFSSIQEIKKMEQELEKSLSLEIKLRDIYDDVLSLARAIHALDPNTAKKQLAEIDTRLNNINKKQCKGFTTKIFYLNSIAELSELKSDKEAVFSCMDEMQQVYEAHKNASKTSDFTYAKFLANYLNYLAIYNKPPELFSTILAKIKSIKIDTLYEEIVNFSNVFYLEFVYYLKQGDFVKMENLLPALLEGLEKYDTQIELGRKIVFWQNLVTYYFLKQDFNNAHFWIQKILDHGKTRRADIFNKSKIFGLLVHYELNEINKSKDTEFLKSLIKNIQYSFKDNPNDLVSLVAKLMRTRCRKIRLEKADFEIILLKFYQIDQSKNPNLPYDEIEIWLKSKIQKLSMQKITEQMLSQSS